MTFLPFLQSQKLLSIATQENGEPWIANVYFGTDDAGICAIATDEKNIKTGIALHNKNFPEFKEKITVDWIHTNEWGSKVWMITPNYVKYWDDELYNDDESEEFYLKK